MLMVKVVPFELAKEAALPDRFALYFDEGSARLTHSMTTMVASNLV